MENDNKFWKNIVHVGGGNLKEFQADYMELSDAAGQFITASQVFPIMSDGFNLRDDNNKPVYEWCIYVKIDPNFQKVLDNNGKVKETLNQEQGKDMDPENVEVVI